MAANQLMKKTGVYLIGNMASKLTSALIIPIYAYFVSTNALGSFDYYQTIMSIASPLLFLAIWEAALRFLIREEDENILEVQVSTIIILSLCSLALMALIAPVLLFAAVTPETIWSVFSMTTAFSVATIWQYLTRAYKDSRFYAMTGFVGVLVNFGLIIVFVCMLNLQLFGLCVSYCCGQLAIVLMIEIKYRFLRKVHISHFKRRIAYQFMLYSFPLAINAVLVAFAGGFGRLFIIENVGAAANGVYAFGMKFGAIVTAIGGIFAMAVIEETILRIGEEGITSFFDTVVNSSFAFFISVGLIALPCISLFFGLFIDNAYESALPLIPGFIAWGISSVMSTLTNCVFQTVAKTKILALFACVNVAVTVIATILLWHMFGLLGVSLALALGNISTLLLSYYIGRKHLQYRFCPLSTILLILCFIVSLLLNTFFATSAEIMPRTIWLLMALLVFLPCALRSLKSLTTIPDRRG